MVRLATAIVALGLSAQIAQAQAIDSFFDIHDDSTVYTPPPSPSDVASQSTARGTAAVSTKRKK